MSAVPRKVTFGTAPKYHNKPTSVVVKGKREEFASKKEADVYASLVLLEKAGRIRNLRRQVPYKLAIGGSPVCKYIADFVFEEYAHGVWTEVVGDAKGFPTPVYKIKRKLMLALLGIEIREM